MKTVRLAAGAVIAAGALYVLIGEQLGGTSADAVLNARLTTLRAPIAGEVSLDRRELGALVDKGEELGSISDPLVDTIRLKDLVLEQAYARAEARRLSDQALDNDAAIAALEERSRGHTNERIAQLHSRVTAARSRAGADEARVEEAAAALSRSDQLQARGFETEAARDRARAAQRVASRELQAAQDEAGALEIELAAARRGIMLADGVSDTPYSQQRTAELRLANHELDSRGEELRARIAALQERIDAERVRVNRLSGAPILSNVRGRVWQILTADGERVQRGQDLVRLVDCSSLMVTLSVSESVYNRLQIGDAAEFRLTGEDRLFPATVTRLAGSGAQTIYSNLAVAPSEEHLERYDVTLTVPSLNDNAQLGCAIGRTGRAFFGARPLDWARDLF